MRWRRRPKLAPHRCRQRKSWTDLVRPADDSADDRAAMLAVELRAEAQRLAAVLGEPTVLLGTVRVPGYLGQATGDEW